MQENYSTKEIKPKAEKKPLERTYFFPAVGNKKAKTIRASTAKEAQEKYGKKK